MAGLPISRPDIQVAVPAFERVEGQWLGVVLTPWSILVIRACGTPETWKSLPVGVVGTVTLPGGDFSFIGMQDEELGEYQSCSLMSPLTDVPNQETGLAIALTAFRVMLKQSQQSNPLPKKKRVIAIRSDDSEAPPEQKPRRDFFTRYWR